jgi:hypothetical protein
VAYLVRSFQTYARNRSLTTGTFNRVVKDRIAIPPKRRRIQSSQTHTSASLTVLETLQTYRAAQSTVNACIPQNFHRISTMGNSGRRTRRTSGAKARLVDGLWAVRLKPHPSTSWGARRYGSSARQVPESTRQFQPCEGGRQKIEKRSYFGGPCLEGTLRKPTQCFRIKPRGRGD